MLNLFIFLLVVLGAQVSDQQSAHVRALQSRRNLHRENARNKVDMLGYLLKKHVSKLRSGDNYEADLVFLVDSSASVGADNFYNEIKFIRKLLADFTVSYNSTRVVIITYSSVNQVIRQVDHMSVPVTTKHKCSLFESEIPAITYNSGGTYTLGALLEAADVFRFSRDTAKKAVFLITDGYSNGGDPRPAAERLKQQGVEFYTFGIRNGNVKELFDMASEPRSEHSFILDSFEEFEALARRALHKDLGGSMYLKQDPKTCSQLCTGSDCCDPVAECSCGAHNGYYSCICPKGFFGRGLKGDCHKCPAGTYKPRLDPGDRRSCIPCPDENQISSPGSFSALQCHCKEGYEIRNGKCTMMDCPPLSPPLNGHFIRNECKNVFNAACGTKCNSGFNLVGSSIRLCLPTGEWSGEPAYCIAKTCRKLQPPSNGFITCSDRTNEVDTVCEFGCNHGYRLIGSSKRTCLPISLWGGLPAYCKPIKCPRLRKPNYGMITPADCSETKKLYGAQCAFACNPGFQLQGPSIRECGEKGSWDGGSYLTRCVDIRPPSLECPENITLPADKNSYHARVMWRTPQPKDNSGFQPLLASVPSVRSPSRFKIGKNIIKYITEDLSGNKNSCVFQIHVQDVEPPVVDYCESPPEFITDTEDVEIVWDEPIFHDNSRDPVVINKSHEFGRFRFGSSLVKYTATDSSGNIAECEITIKLQKNSCSEPKDPINGHKNCSQNEHAVQCTLACDEGFAFAFKPTQDYFCEVTGPGTWYPENSVLPYPDCSVTSLSSILSIPTDLRVSIVSNSPQRKHICDDSFFLKQVAEHVRKKVLDQLDLVCGNSMYCDIQDLEAICADIIENQHILSNQIYRKRRSVYTPYMYGDYNELEDGGTATEDVAEEDGKVGEVGSDAYSVSVSSPGVDQRQVIEIIFKLIGKLKSNVERIEEQINLMKGVNSVQVGIEDAASSGNLDIMIGQELIITEEIDFSEPNFLCEIGSIVDGNSCVNCPVGTFFNIVTRTCSPCTSGSYQDQEAQVTCLVCPGGTYTRIQVGATNPQACKAQCLPGTISVDGLERCRTCQIGEYQSEYAQVTCSACPGGKSTISRGATSLSQCKDACPPGKSSETGLEPCFPCPQGYFQPHRGQTNCLRCPRKVLTQFISSASINDCQGLTNPEAYDLKSLELLEVNDCFSLPCLNSGTCIPLSQGIQCICEQGFGGSYCETRLDPCQSFPCINLGICEISGSSYTCTCQPGYAGPDCQIDIDECLNDECMNNSTCIEDNYDGGMKRYSCECQDGFQGEFCEENVDDCVNHGCENEGECIDGLGTFSCLCKPGFRGRVCEEELDDCIGSPCGLGATCIDRTNGYNCICPPGKTGENCEYLENLCLTSPCFGFSTCLPTSGHFQCICPPGFSGNFCQTQILPNFILTFGNSPSTETLDYVLLDQMYTPLDQFTMCFWMKSDDKDNYGTAFSYATVDQDNELTVTDYNGFVLSVKGEKVVTDVTANDGNWHFLCLSWDSYSGIWMVYKDGVLQDTGEGLAKGTFIEDGGLVVIGQEQDERGDDFSAAESFRGSITRLDLWSRVLSQDEIQNLRVACEPYYGDVISWSDMYRGLRGEIRISDSELCQSCPNLENIEHGTLRVQGSGPLSTGVLGCENGYYLEGSEEISCNIFGEWDTDLPNCRLINCGFPGYLHNGAVTGNSYLFRDVVSFSCDTGYRLSGPLYQTCLGNGSWSSNKPKCQEIRCSFPEIFPHGQFNIRTQDKLNSTARIGDKIVFSCDPGFYLDGLDRLDCMEDGTWSDLPPICQPVPCTQPPIVPNGYIAGGTPDTIKQGTVLTFNCDPGYEISDTDSVLCGSRGQWIKPVPKCEPVLCSTPENVPNGKTWFDGTRFGEMVIYKCKKGHYLLGSLNSTCTRIGVWEPPPPTCVPVDCGDLEPVQEGSVQYVSTTYKNTAKYSCKDGYSLRGSEERQCTSSGLWSRREPECVPIQCDPPVPIPLGYLEKNETYSSGETAMFSCLPGHKLIQDTPLACDHNGSWSGSTPRCVPALCAGPAALPNGTLIIGTWSKEPLPEASVSYLRDSIEKRKGESDPILIPCSGSKPLRLEPNDKNTVFYPVGSELWFDCSAGYQIIGSSTNLCQNENEWESKFPICQEVICSNVQSLSNGRITVDGFKFRQYLKYDCDDGYNLVGDATRTCLETGEWSGTEPSCVPRMCPEPKDIPNGWIEDWISLEYGSVIIYRCEPGFKLLGGGERVCGHLGEWSGQLPACVNTSQTCLVPQLLNSGYIAFDGNLEVGSLAWYDCNDDHELVGESERMCIENGTWSGNQPVCNPRYCSTVQSIQHGSVVGRIYEHGSVLQFSCNSGYILHGADSIYCLETGTWSKPIPVCVPIICSEPDQVLNGLMKGSARRFDDSIVYECNPGYTLLGPRVRKCDLSGDWSGSNPYCASITCSELTPIPNGVYTIELRVPGEKARFKCDIGYILQGANNITCNSFGEWEGDIPRCIPATCTLDLFSTQASLLDLEQEEYEVGTKLRWNCRPGYKMVGSNLTTCLPNGEWNLDPPTCRIHQCKDVFKLENGVIFGTKNISQSLEVRFSCDNGYTKIIDSFLDCDLDGRWKGTVPICSRRACPTLLELDHGEVTLAPSRGSYIAEFKCRDIFELKGHSRLDCRSDGTWSHDKPKCVLSYCPDIENISKMIYPRRKTRVGESVRFQCEPGYVLKGSGFVKCDSQGRWESELPICIPATCTFQARIRHGEWRIQPSRFRKSLWAQGTRVVGLEKLGEEEGELAVGDILQVECDPGYNVYGESEILCQVDLVLSAPIPKCKPVYCPKLSSIENGNIIHNGTYRGAALTFTCNQGFELIGPSVRKCRRNKTWSKTTPECQPIKCKRPHNIAHGKVDYNPNDLHFRSKVRFYCNLGYELTGGNERECGDDGSWVGEEPECILIQCPPPRIPLHGEQDIHELTVGGTVSYSCNQGFKLQGSRIITCLNNKTWSGQVPICSKITCKLPRNIPHGFVAFSDQEYQANIEYRCEDGYTLSGLRTRSCLYSGEWGGEEPTCIHNICPQLVLKNGWVRTDGSEPGDEARLGCNPGFQISGVSVLVCQMNLSWTPSLPTCIPLICPQPAQVAHGVAEVQGYSYLDTVSYTCNPGYEIRGNTELICSEDSSWRGDIPSCLPKPCGLPRSYQNMEVSFESEGGYDLGFGSRAVYSCISGFLSEQRNILTCTQDGTWRGTIHPCIEVPCGIAPLPGNGSVELRVSGSTYTAEMRCNPGFRLLGRSSIICQEDSTWQFSMVECIPVDCGEPGLVEDGSLVAVGVGEGTELGSRRTLVCREGFLPGELNEIVCTENGTWNRTDLSCNLALCPSLQSIQHGSVRYINNKNSQDLYPSGTIAEFSCGPGYVLYGSPNLTCLQDQTWAGTIPHCQRVWCGGVEPPQHGFLMGVGKQFGDIIRFSCEDGYRIFGPGEIECLASGRWSSSPPSCHWVWCDAPTPGLGQLLPGTIEPSYPHRSRIQLICRQGHRQRGDLNIFCQANGRWSRPEGACHRISCNKPQLESGATLLSQTFLFGSRVPYTCPSGEYPVNSPLHCLVDGTWSSNPGRCFKINK